MPQFARADRTDRAAQGQGRAGRLHRRRVERRRDAGGRRRRPSAPRSPYVPAERLYPCTNCGMAPMAAEIAYAKLAALAAGAELARKGDVRPRQSFAIIRRLWYLPALVGSGIIARRDEEAPARTTLEFGLKPLEKFGSADKKRFGFRFRFSFDFVAPDLDFVAGALDFVAPDLDFHPSPGGVAPRRALQRKPAIDDEGLPGGEGALVGGEVDGDRGDLLRLAEPAHRLAVDERLADLLDRLAARARSASRCGRRATGSRSCRGRWRCSARRCG